MQRTAIPFAALALAAMFPLVLRGDDCTAADNERTAPASVAPAIVTIIEDFRAFLHEASGGIAFSGFFDLNASARQSRVEDVTFGNFELGVARNIGTRAEFVGAVVANGEGAQVTSAHLAVRISPAPATADERAALRLRVGRFDVPFGIDWQHYAAKDRVEISAPLTTTTILDGGMNANGVDVSGSARSIEYSAFTLRAAGRALSGGRLGLSSRRLSAGMSFMRLTANDDAVSEQMAGLDADVRFGQLHGRAEYFEREPRNGGTPRITGWHATLDTKLAGGRQPVWTPFARYETVSTTVANSFAQHHPRGERRFTAGLNATVEKLFTFKIEYQRELTGIRAEADENPSRDAWLAQVVLSF